MSEPWYPGEYRPAPQYPPHYNTMPDSLRVVDRVQLWSPTQAAFWRKCRDIAFTQWTRVGVPIVIKAKGEDKPNRVTLAFSNDLPPLSDGSKMPAWHQFNEDGSDWIHFDQGRFYEYYKSNVRQTLVYIIAHEFGHSLGFGHGGDGIMDATPDHAHVNAEEAEVVREYWGLTA